uniref:Uncharacterized protein n=1 Tax=Rhizophora mucronata TaxID=61149 RepID=A0A2P2QVA7_RHIMU
MQLRKTSELKVELSKMSINKFLNNVVLENTVL